MAKGTRKVYKLTDKSLILGVEVDSTEHTVTIQEPFSITQMQNPQTGEPEIGFLPMDLIFSDVTDTKNNVTMKKYHVMWEKDMSDFPNYEQNYVHQSTGIETVSSGIIKG